MDRVLRNVIVFSMLITSVINIFLFISKWVDTDFDAAWKAFEDHVDNCLNQV